ncbi:alpha-amylase family glycosyl hydrolase [Paraflavitalea sp. CAU 1676]|uniref:alpha-amylase family glycosyl hydrolase n=1 Tax=Paraflavitalea sp. CAU 1676 TaxID=3032598 RepID=UPI0023DCB051|nr:alpha-amylase family glycosyl hydrolase [Paraflavitalea sp. CAU 1676]MDF2186916.1 alpha-amylase family glycosyl hydrolase [Paraflavitalea sp. CAU 1676]
MKSLVLVILCALLSTTVPAQLLTTAPAFPADNAGLTITVDCSKGNQGLLNYGNTNDVYVHIGVITNLSTSNTDWKYSKFAWGTADVAARATSIAPNKYQYNIGNVRTFFNVPASETIRRIAILFRNGAGDKVQRVSDPNADMGNIYITVYDNALSGKFTSPSFEPRFVPVAEPIAKTTGETIDLAYIANKTAGLKLFFNGAEIASEATGTSLQASALIAASGNQQIVGRVTDGVNTHSDTINFFAAPPVSVQPLPVRVLDGVNYEQGDTSVILVLYAPNKNKVSVLGDFNNWTEAAGYQMNKTPDGLRFWKRITALVPGTEYGYQYLVDNTLRIADPYTHKVLDPNNDQFIAATTYPNLKAYPAGKTTGIVSLLQTARPAYSWQVNNFTRPDKRNLLIYELLLRDFIGNHDWKTLKDTLGYLKRLGINAIELMPFNEFEGNLSWGYNPSFYFAPDKYYGPERDLKVLIDECHKQGIAVIMDMVLNHSFGQSPMVQLYFDAAKGQPAAESPWFNTAAKHPSNVGYDFNHESAATQYFVSRVVEYWLKEYKLDGFRFDLSKGFTQKASCDAAGANCNQANWDAYDASRIAIWKKYYDTIQLKSAGSYVILEHLGVNDEEKELASYGMMLWGNMNHTFNEATMGYNGGSDFKGAIHVDRGWSQPSLVSYMESHDEERLMYKNVQFGNAAGGYNVKDPVTALRRNEMAAAFYFAIPGPKMIWQFGEWGYDYSINYCENGTINDACRTNPKPVKWEYQQSADRKKLFDVYGVMLALRTHPAYRNGFTTDRISWSLSSTFKWLKLTTDTSNMLVVGNFDVSSTTGTVTFQNAGTWYDYLTGQTIQATGSAQSISLQPGEYHVYLNRNITNILTPVSDLDDMDKNTRLSIYPNPVTSNSTIEFELPLNTEVALSLLHSNGRLLAYLKAGFKAKGVHQLPLHKLKQYGLSPGLYFIRMQYGNNSIVKKLIID